MAASKKATSKSKSAEVVETTQLARPLFRAPAALLRARRPRQPLRPRSGPRPSRSPSALVNLAVGQGRQLRANWFRAASSASGSKSGLSHHWALNFPG